MVDSKSSHHQFSDGWVDACISGWMSGLGGWTGGQPRPLTSKI